MITVSFFFLEYLVFLSNLLCVFAFGRIIGIRQDFLGRMDLAGQKGFQFPNRIQ